MNGRYNYQFWYLFKAHSRLRSGKIHIKSVLKCWLWGRRHSKYYRSSFAFQLIVKKVLGIFDRGKKHWVRDNQLFKYRQKHHFGQKNLKTPPPAWGGTKPIFDIATSDFKNLPNLHFTPKLAHFGLKMIIRHFSSKFWKKILTPIFRFWGIPARANFFFRKLFYENRISSLV